LSNKNEIVTVSKSKKKMDLNKASVSDLIQKARQPDLLKKKEVKRPKGKGK